MASNSHIVRKPRPGARLSRARPLANGLVAFWPLIDGSGLPFDAAAQVPAASNSATWAVGPYGPALSFNGTSQFVSLGSSTPWLNIVGPITVAAFANPPSGKNGFLVDGHQAAANPGWYLSTELDSTFDAWANGTNVASSTGACDGNYHTFAYSQSSTATGGVQFYRDGRAWGTATLASYPTAWTGARAIGSRSDGGARWLTGSVGWAAVWNRALSAAEHAAIGANPNAIYQLLYPPRPALAYGRAAAAAIAHNLSLLGCGH